MKTYSAKAGEVSQDWYLVDASDKVLGRLATEIARRLRGKHKPEFTPHMDTGDNIVVINAEKIKVTGGKMDGKIYYRHSGYPGGLKSQTFRELIEKHPERALSNAVKGMIPRGPLGRAVLKKLRVYAGPEHPHAGQQLKQLDI